jgi:hypothetical protein
MKKNEKVHASEPSERARQETGAKRSSWAEQLERARNLLLSWSDQTAQVAVDFKCGLAHAYFEGTIRSCADGFAVDNEYGFIEFDLMAVPTLACEDHQVVSDQLLITNMDGLVAATQAYMERKRAEADR